MQIKVIMLLATLIFAFICCGAVSAANDSTNLTLNTSKMVNSSENTSTKQAISPYLTVSGTRDFNPTNPDVYGNNVIFEYSDVTPDYDVYLWDTQAQTITPLSNSKQMWEGQPKIYGTNMVWTDSSPPGSTMNPISQIVYEDLTTKNYQILMTGSMIPKNPSIYGSTVVWDCISSDPGRNVVCLGGPGKQTQSIAYGQKPDIYGNNVVYIDIRNNAYGLYLYNTATGTEKLVSTSSGQMDTPKIYDQTVVWADTRSGSSDIWMYDLSTNTIKDITLHSSVQYDPAIWGNNIVWSDNRNGNYDIYGYNIITGATTRLTNSSYDELDPSVYQNTLVYTKDYDIYYQPVDAIPPTASASPLGDYYNVSKTVTLTMSESGTIYYTLDGTTPTTSSTIYKSPISITSTKTLKYLAVDSAGNESPVYAQTYTIDTAAPTASASPQGGYYNKAVNVTLKMSESGTIYWRSSNLVTAMFMPVNIWHEYTSPVTINSSSTIFFYAKDLAGNPSQVYNETYIIDTSNFTVDTTPPKVASVNPANNARINVTSKTITVTFSESVNAGNNYIEFKTNSGTAVPFTTSISGKTLTIKPSILLSKGVKYNLILHAGCVSDLAGNSLSFYTSSFTVDTTSPKVTSTSPKNKATKVSRTSTIAIKFSEKIKSSVKWSKVYVKNIRTSKKISISKLIKGNMLYIKTSKRLAHTWYQVYIPAYAIKDYAGNKLAKGYTFKFKTGK